MAWGKPFQKGQSGNPGGRSPAVAAVAKKILAATNNLDEVIEFALSVLRGTAGPDLKDGKSRRWAADLLFDRALGKPAQRIDVATGDAPARVDYSMLTDEELAQLEAITAKLQLASTAAAPVEGAGDSGGRVH